MDSSSYSEDNQVDERYIKKSVEPVRHPQDDIVGDPISKESNQGEQFKELLSGSDNSELAQNDCHMINSDSSQKQQKQEQILLVAHQVIEPQNAAQQYILKDEAGRQLQAMGPNQELDQQEGRQQDGSVKPSPYVQIQVKEIKRKIHPMRLEDFKEEIENKIQPDENYLEYIRLKKMEFEGINHLPQPDKKQPRLQNQVLSIQDQPINIQESSKKIEQQLFYQAEQRKDNLLNSVNNQANQSYHEPEMKVQPVEQSPFIQSQIQRKKLKQQQQSQSQKMNYFKDAIVKQMKEQWRKMVLQQRLIRNQFISNAIAELREGMEQKMNENREQYSRESSSLKNMMLKMNDSIKRLEERLLNMGNEGI